MNGRNLLMAFGLCLAVVATNRYEGPPTSFALAPGDGYSYFKIAESAPGLPQETFLFHHVQRLALPYVVGMVHRAVPIPLHLLFQIAVGLMALATLLIFAAILGRLSVPRRLAALVLAVLAFNPWTFRPFLTFPETVNDLGFVLGLAVMLRGLVAGQRATVLLGQIVASLSRQTGLLLLPLVVVWLWRDRETWARASAASRLALCVSVGGLAVAIYAGTAWLAAGVAAPNENAKHVLGLASWLVTQFDARALAAFLFRALMLPIIPLVFFIGVAGQRQHEGRASSAVPALVLVSLCIWAQPLLGGPDVTGGSAQRLMALGLLPFCLAFAIRLRDAGAFAEASSRGRVFATVALLALGSVHHWYVLAAVPSTWQKVVFAVSYTMACGGCFVLMAIEVRNLPGTAT